VKYCTEVLEKRLRESIAKSARISPPGPSPLAKAKNFFRYQIILRAKAVSIMVNPLKLILKDIKFPKSVSVAVDLDALDLM
jgi:primosomal protein N'